jgi:hypothetical protein
VDLALLIAGMPAVAGREEATAAPGRYVTLVGALLALLLLYAFLRLALVPVLVEHPALPDPLPPDPAAFGASLLLLLVIIAVIPDPAVVTEVTGAGSGE